MNIPNYLAGGANSPIPNWEGYPELVVSGEGAVVTSSTGEKYIDMWMGYGALLYGHSPYFLKKSLQESINKGWFFSYPTSLERNLAEKIHYLLPSADKIRFATSGSDAVAYAIRAARAYTGKEKVLKVKSSYHGVHENLVSNFGAISDVFHESIKFNEIKELKERLVMGEYACFIIEPILANGGTVPPDAGYLQKIRDICTDTGTVLIFDEVVTGFRVNIGGAQSEFGVKPDMTTLSKSIAGGLPLSVVCGDEKIMDMFMPKGKVFFAGTFNGSPLALESAIAIINELETNPPYRELENLRERIVNELTIYARKIGVKIGIQGYGSMLSIAFDVESYKHGVHESGANEKKYIEYVKYLAGHEKILLPPLYTETIFLSQSHLKHEYEIVDSLKAGLKFIA